MGWRVGDGASIPALRSKWVSGLQGRIADTMEEGGWAAMMGTEMEELRVDELMVADGGAWNKPVVEALFPTHVGSLILKMPIGECGHKDELYWCLDEKGFFSVKSAYLLSIGFFEQDPSCSNPDRKFWTRLVWQVPVPPKVRVFLWRACKNFIPAAANLRRHHVPVFGVCSLCFDRWGSTEHAIFFCPHVLQVWRQTRFWRILKKARGLSFVDIARAVLKETTADDYALWATLAWRIWGMVCRLLHPSDEVVETPSEMMCEAMLEAYTAARPTLQLALRLGVELGARKWRRPRPGCFRADVDALFDPAAWVFGVGIVVRDDGGNIVLALSQRTTPKSSAAMAEIMAVVHGIVACVEHEFVPIMLFTDSFVAARLMAADPEEERGLLPHDVAEVLSRARAHALVGVFHMYRSANRAVHRLAQEARNCDSVRCWTNSFHPWLRAIVSDDRD